ncbi:MAG: response regulator [Gammaproteobacteria bacterium]|nr:response regulator [Gammaproteobacteria bacterium]MBU2179340.1 response regulator [Gammaproteobacteria bacterium]MBU2223328.1 response regulator [Gammaproteobacteria bacterium]MBU2426812.1 response regulator [Gammaproteobacteria bacterium]
MSERAHLLLVDDEKTNLKVLAELLRPDYRIRLAQSGQQALEKCLQQAPDLILMDVLMPGMDGFETLKALKAETLTAQIPIIFITGLQSADHEQQGLQLGAQDYIHKPFHAEVVKARVATQLKLIRQRQELQQLSEQLTQANEAKSRFLATISHEIRTPLASVIGYAEAILAGEFAENEQLQAIQTICQNGKHLQALLNDLLDLSKIAANKLDIELLPVNLCQLVDEITTLLQDKARQKGLDFQFDYQLPLPAMIKTDPTRLKQILLNLCNNAIKFTEQGFVKVQISRIDDELQFAVHDSGIGIAPDQQQKLFHAFGQADVSVQRQFGGTGLGLVIARQLCEKLNGSLQLQSSTEAGSCFVAAIALDILPDSSWLQQASDITEQQKRAIPTPLPRQQMRGRILLAEDQNDTRQLLVRMLQHAGLEVTAVNNGQSLVETALTGDFDLILSDIQMPKMDGVAAIALLRAAGIDTPCVALTANTMLHEVQTYLAAGFATHLAKPVDRHKFAAVLHHFLGGQPFRQQLQLPTAELEAMTARFVQTLPGQMAELQQNCLHADWSAARYQAHALKGTAALFGLTDLSLLASELEQQLLQTEPVQAETKNTVQQLCQRLTEQSTHLIEQS